MKEARIQHIAVGVIERELCERERIGRSDAQVLALHLLRRVFHILGGEVQPLEEVCIALLHAAELRPGLPSSEMARE